MDPEASYVTDDLLHLGVHISTIQVGPAISSFACTAQLKQVTTTSDSFDCL